MRILKSGFVFLFLFWFNTHVLAVNSELAFHLKSISEQDSTLSQKRSYFKNEITFIEFVSLNPFWEEPQRYRARGDLFKKNHTSGYFRSILYKDSIDMTRFDERKFIDDTTKNVLEKILFDVPHPEMIYSHACYEPRNCILFYDKSKVLLGIMEICFECEDVRYSAGFPMQLKLCHDQFIALKKLFFLVGIRRGVE